MNNKSKKQSTIPENATRSRALRLISLRRRRRQERRLNEEEMSFAHHAESDVTRQSDSHSV